MNCTNPIRVALATLAATFCLPAQSAPVARTKAATAATSAPANAERLQVRLAEVIAMLEEDDLTAEQRAEAKKKLVEIQQKLKAAPPAPRATALAPAGAVAAPIEGQWTDVAPADGATRTFVVEGHTGDQPVAVARGLLGLRGLTVRAADSKGEAAVVVEGAEVAQPVVVAPGQRVLTLRSGEGESEVAIVVAPESTQDPKPAQEPKAPKPPKAPKAPKAPKPPKAAKAPVEVFEMMDPPEASKAVRGRRVGGDDVKVVEVEGGEWRKTLGDVEKLRVKADALRAAGDKMRVEVKGLEDAKVRWLKAGEALDTRGLEVDELRKLGATLRADGVKNKRVAELLHADGFTRRSGTTDNVKALVERARKAEQEGDLAEAHRVYVKADGAKVKAADAKRYTTELYRAGRLAERSKVAAGDDDDDDGEIRKLIDEMRKEMREIRALLNDLRKQQSAAPRARTRGQSNRDDDDDDGDERDGFAPAGAAAGGTLFGRRSAPRGGLGG
ncbi:MAG: hypothetical protein WAT39_03465, partial [Planctomycetota bacterium]